MLRGEVNPYPIQLIVNYWEIPTSALGAHLNELLRQGVSHLATFVPWQAVESDISHALSRFLQAVAERKMTVSLILTPEVGVNYPNSGLPKDLISKPDAPAKHALGNSIFVNLPPNSFALPSLVSSDFGKRYQNFLARVDTLLADLGKSEPQILAGVKIILTGSYWKFYRAPQSAAKDPFADRAGDFSGGASVSYRQRMELFYQQSEFNDSAGNPATAPGSRWKTRPMEEVNRRWFYQHCEDVFRTRSTHGLGRRARGLDIEQIELFTPEADPGFMYSNFLQMVSGFNGDFFRLGKLVEEAATRATSVCNGEAPSFIHWTALGGFRTLSDSEKQFLILKSLLLMGGCGGGILIDESEWFALSRGFRSRAENIARLISQGDLRIENRALYLAPHLWSSAGPIWDELRTRLGANARMIASTEKLKFEQEAKLLVVDPRFILTEDAIGKILAWARAGHTVAIPKTDLFTDTARFHLEEALAESQRPIDMNLGFAYRIQEIGEGSLIVYEGQESETAVQAFVSSLLSVSDAQLGCRSNDAKLGLIPMRKRDGGLGLFILNGTSRPIAGDLLFRSEVGIADLWSSIGPKSDANRAGVIPANRFALEVPPSGVLPLSVEGLTEELHGARAPEGVSRLIPVSEASRELGGTQWS